MINLVIASLRSRMFVFVLAFGLLAPICQLNTMAIASDRSEEVKMQIAEINGYLQSLGIKQQIEARKIKDTVTNEKKKSGLLKKNETLSTKEEREINDIVQQKFKSKIDEAKLKLLSLRAELKKSQQ